MTASGLTTELEIGDAEPQAGFWVELAGAVVALGGAAALALAARARCARARGGGR